MDAGTALMVAGAGVIGGIMNAIAGGATLVTFPAMLAAGLPPVIANASNTVAIVPGNLIAAWADRRLLPAAGPRLLAFVASAIAGGGIGALLLLATPEDLFTRLVPALIGAATLIFAFGKQVQRLLGGAHDDRPRLRSALVAPVAVYGGYFGAGLGVMLMAVLTVTGREQIRTANALKNLLSTAVAFVSIVIFVTSGVVRWPETLAMLSGALAGGWLGSRLIAILPVLWVRVWVIVIGTAMTLIYAARYWV
jgi:uncharacterized membrane protein YfcA